VLGVATATSINKVTITAPATSATLTIANGGSLVTSGAFSITLTATAGTSVTLPTTGTLYGTASGSITSLQLKTSLSDETGSGAAVFATSPSLVTAAIAGYTLTGVGTIGNGCTMTTPVLGAATATSLTASGLVTGATMGSIATTAFSGATLALSGAATITCGAIACTTVTGSGAITAAGLVLSAGSGIKVAPTSYSADGAISTTAGIALITKAGVAAMTVAAPSSIDGQELTIINGSNNAHVITFTGGTLYDGTAGANSTATFAAFIGAAITVIASGSTWLAKNYHATTIAP
jgi:hypothetical protein